MKKNLIYYKENFSRIEKEFKDLCFELHKTCFDEIGYDDKNDLLDFFLIFNSINIRSSSIMHFLQDRMIRELRVRIHNDEHNK